MNDLPIIFHKLAIMAIPERDRGFALSDAKIVEIANEACNYIREVTRAPAPPPADGGE